MASLLTEFFELMAKLGRVKEATGVVDEDHVKDLEKRVIESVEKNSNVLDEKLLEDIQHLNMVDLVQSQTKLKDDGEMDDTKKLVSGKTLLMEPEKRKEDMKPQDEYDVTMEAFERKLRIKVWIDDKEFEDTHLDDFKEFNRNLELLQPKRVQNIFTMHMDDETKLFITMKEIIQRIIAKMEEPGTN